MVRPWISRISSFNEIFSPEEVSRIYNMRQRRSELAFNGTAALNEQIKALKNEKRKITSKNKTVQSEEELLAIIDRARRENAERNKNN